VRRGVPIARQPRAAADFECARLRSIASANASSLEELDELYPLGDGATVGEVIAQFGCDRRRSSADEIELGLRFARLSFGAGHHAALARTGERDANRLRGHSADR
jgi:hypothetical protein